MHDEFTARQRAITLRLSGQPVEFICQALGRSAFWFHKWWRRYLEAGVAGLYDRTHATHHVAQRIAPELERTILSIRRRLQAHASPATRYSLIGASAILERFAHGCSMIAAVGEGIQTILRSDCGYGLTQPLPQRLLRPRCRLT
jgi:transposase-like protein